MELDEPRNGTGDTDDEYTNIYFMVGDRMETATFQPDHVTNKELKELFRSAAEAGPLDIVKLRRDDKLLNISPQLPFNTPETPYVLQVVGAHPASSGMIEADVLRALERRVAALERELRDHQEAASSEPSIALRDLKRQMDAFKSKLETTEHLSWLGFYKQLPEPVSSEACRRLQYRRKSDSVKRRVREKFLNISDVAVSSSVREWLRSPAFDARQWEDEELLLMLQSMFIELELLHKFDISITTLGNFLYETYNNYNEVPFHNFRHCFCVAQMMYAIAWAVDLPSKIGHLEVFVLIVSCICHDLDHPGYNNIYQINARTELALRYNDISPLENHHCSVTFRVLEAPECNILASLDPATFRSVREGIIRCILATDMARHNEILSQFTDIVPEFDYQNRSHINLLSMVLIKVADISNEARPIDVADPWLDRLLQEFFKQSDAEKLEGLPVTPFMDRDKVTKPSSQCSFIGLVLLPLFEALGELFPELQELIVEPARYALEYYRRLNEAAKDERHHRKSVVDIGESGMGGALTGPGSAVIGGSGSGTTGTTGTSGSVTKSTSSHSMRSKRSTNTIRSRSRSTDEDLENATIEESENLESSDPETATEVEISEKTLKFKISTEGNVPTVGGSTGAGRKSYPGSRKGSRDRSSIDYHNHDFAKAFREHERRRSRGDNFSSDVSSPVSARSYDDARIIEELEKDEEEAARNESAPGDEATRLSEGNGRILSTKGQPKNVSCRIRDENPELSSVDDDEEVVTERKDSATRRGSSLRCCCDEKSTSNNHKSLLSRLRNFTDRLSISFDSREPPPTKLPGKQHESTSRNLSKSESVCGSSVHGQNPVGKLLVCKRCNLMKCGKADCEDAATIASIAEVPPSVVAPLGVMEKRAMTLPKARKSQDAKNKSWRMVFVKEKRPSVSLETLPSRNDDITTTTDTSTGSSSAIASKHRRNLSNPEGKMSSMSKTQSLKASKNDSKLANYNDFKEIDVRRKSASKDKPEIIVHPGSSSIVDDSDDVLGDDIGKVEIRRSSASMEDISKITKEREDIIIGGGLEEMKKTDDHQHTGSLDSMLYKDSSKCGKKSFGLPSSPYIGKKSSPGLFSRFKSGMSIDVARSTSGSLNDQPQQIQHHHHHQQQTGWISSLTASFRPKRQTGELPHALGPPSLRSPGHEGVK